MNKIYIDQIARYMNNTRFQLKNYYEDQAMAAGALQWFIQRLDKELGNCHGVEDGRCQFYWKHDDCVRLMALLADLTGDEKYKLNIPKPTLWD